MGKTIIAILVALSLAACGDKSTPPAPAAPKKAAVAAARPAPAPAPAPAPTAEPAKKTKKKATKVAKKTQRKTTTSKPAEAKKPAVTSPDGGPRNDGPG
jgi:hypothetical protein